MLSAEGLRSAGFYGRTSVSSRWETVLCYWMLLCNQSAIYRIYNFYGCSGLSFWRFDLNSHTNTHTYTHVHTRTHTFSLFLCSVFTQVHRNVHAFDRAWKKENVSSSEVQKVFCGSTMSVISLKLWKPVCNERKLLILPSTSFFSPFVSKIPWFCFQFCQQLLERRGDRGHCRWHRLRHRLVDCSFVDP